MKDKQPGLVVSASSLGIPLPIERARLTSIQYIFKIGGFYSSHISRIELIIRFKVFCSFRGGSNADKSSYKRIWWL